VKESVSVKNERTIYELRFMYVSMSLGISGGMDTWRQRCEHADTYRHTVYDICCYPLVIFCQIFLNCKTKQTKGEMGKRGGGGGGKGTS